MPPVGRCFAAGVFTTLAAPDCEPASVDAVAHAQRVAASQAGIDDFS
jgi:hypothetical protein